jgi:hypothetical protein
MINPQEAVAVLVAKSLNVSIFQQVWLLENGILSKEETAGNALFSPVSVNIPGAKFDFLVVPDRVQVVVKSDFESAGAIFDRTIGNVAKVLPHTPYTGLGLNFNYLVEPSSQESFFSASRKLVLSERNPLANEFSTSDARFGLYVSKNILSARLKLDIKPIKKGVIEALLMNFNFHHDVSNAKHVIDALDNWLEFFRYSSSLAQLLRDAIEEADNDGRRSA